MFNNADTKKNQNNMLIKPAGVGIIFTVGCYAHTKNNKLKTTTQNNKLNKSANQLISHEKER